MKRVHPPEEHAKFNGGLRHYHRSGSQAKRSWDDWVEGAAGKAPKSSRNWLKILGITLGGLALAGIATGLIIELG